MNKDFLAALESYLDLSHTKISFSEEWSKTGPGNVRGIPLKDYITKVCTFSVSELHKCLCSYRCYRPSIFTTLTMVLTISEVSIEPNSTNSPT